METVLIYSDNLDKGARVELQGSLGDLGFTVSHLVLRYDGKPLNVQ